MSAASSARHAPVTHALNEPEPVESARRSALAYLSQPSNFGVETPELRIAEHDAHVAGYLSGYAAALVEAAQRLRTSRLDGGGAVNPPVQHDQMVEMYSAGVPVPEIASRLGVSERTVYRHVSASGVEHVRAPREPRGLTGGSWRYCPRRRVQVWVEETAA